MTQDQEFLIAGMRHVARAEDLDVVIRGLVQASAASVGTHMGSFFWLDSSRGMLKPAVLVNLPESYLEGCAEVPLGTQCCGRAALHKVPWVVEDMWTDPLFVDCRQAAKSSGIRSAFSIPVLDSTGDCLGSLASHFQDRHSPTVEDIDRQTSFAKLIAYALIRQRQLTLGKAAAAD